MFYHQSDFGDRYKRRGACQSSFIATMALQPRICAKYSPILDFSQVFSLDGGYEAWTTRPSATDGALDKTLQNWLTANGFLPKDVNAVITKRHHTLMKAKP